jgi:hypothetical protein
VVGASGFLGSHVTRQVVERGERVRVLLHRTSSTVAIDDFDVERHYGDVFDDEAVRRTAMTDCEDMYYCVVDTRAWRRDPAPLFRTNVEDCGPTYRLTLSAFMAATMFLVPSVTGAPWRRVSDGPSALITASAPCTASRNGSRAESSPVTTAV